MKSLKDIFDFSQSLPPAARTASTNGSALDLANYGSCGVIVSSGTITDGTHTPKLQESADNVAWSDVAVSDLVGTFANIASSAVQKVGYIDGKRYLRVVVTVAGATTGGLYGAIALLGGKRKQP